MTTLSINVFDGNLNRLTVIDAIEHAEFEHKYENHGLLTVIMDASEANAGLFFNLSDEELRIITKTTEPQKGFIVECVEYTDDRQLEILIRAKSASSMTAWRIVEGQQRFTGTAEEVMRAFVTANCITPANPNRIIPRLVLGAVSGIDIKADEAYSDKWLDEILWEICRKYEVTFEILLNHQKKRFEFIVLKGLDRSTRQAANKRVIFAREFDNINRQTYIDDKSSYRTTAYVAGEGEGTARTVLKLKDSLKGYARREVFFDARDLQSKYTDENGNEITVPPTEYNKLLLQRGENRISEYIRVQSFASDIDLNSQFLFGKDYALGDIISMRNDRLNIIMHPRVMVARETYKRSGYDLKLEFGTAIPTFMEKIRRELK